jgi:hypothetical protein
MRRTDLFIKVQLDHKDDEDPAKLGEEICRRVLKIYGVRSAEVSSLVTHPETAE